MQTTMDAIYLAKLVVQIFVMCALFEYEYIIVTTNSLIIALHKICLKYQSLNETNIKQSVIHTI